MNATKTLGHGTDIIRRPLAALSVVGGLLLGLCAGVGFAQVKPGQEAPQGRKQAQKPDHKAHAKSKEPGVVSLDVFAEGSRLHLLLAERKPGAAPQLSYRGSSDGGATWSEPVPVGRGQPGPEPVKRGADAQIAAAGDRLVAVWTTGANTRFGRGPLATAVSGDGGRTWKPGPNPSDDGLSTDHAYVDVAASDDGTFHAVWLDGREGEGTGKGLRYARSTDGGLSWSANVTLDEQCCECCWNVIQTLPGGRVNVLYRDRDPRDMALLASTDGGESWDAPVTVGSFEWAFDGCPHVGGALAGAEARGGRSGGLFAVVWTAKGGSDVGVFALASPDGGKSWKEPVQLGGPQSNRPDVAYVDGRVVAVWDGYSEGGNAVFTADSRDGGASWSKPQLLSSPQASSTHPRVVRTATGLRAFWTEHHAGKPVTWASRELE